eukprot:3378508-Lingulodinium_polyedra.AAC.1
MAYIGVQPDEVALEITFLKGCKLLATLDGRPTNKDTVLAALGILHNEALGDELSKGWPAKEKRA